MRKLRSSFKVSGMKPSL